jgi:hypothetical protein
MSWVIIYTCEVNPGYMEENFQISHPASQWQLQRTAYEWPLEREKNPFQRSTEVVWDFYLLYWDKLAVVPCRLP